MPPFRPSSPLIVFAADARGVLTMIGGAGLAALGRTPGQCLGKTAAELYPDNPTALAAAHAALSGERVTFRAEFYGHMLESTCLPQFDTNGTLIGIIGAAYGLLDGEPAPHAEEPHYEISAKHGAFGQILGARIGGHQRQDLVGQRCFTAFWGRPAECASCPARAPRGKQPLTRVVTRMGGEGYLLATATWTSKDTLSIHERPISESQLTELIQARVNLLADKGALSPRERQVLQLMLLGRSPADIGRALGIVERTGKFHQVNVLAKLGAESRLDLQRIVLQTEAPSKD